MITLRRLLFFQNEDLVISVLKDTEDLTTSIIITAKYRRKLKALSDYCTPKHIMYKVELE